MKTYLGIVFFFTIWSGCLLGQTWSTEEEYVQNFARYAVEEMEKHKIPASISLAQGIIESGGGQSRLAREGNNHFGIKCKENWKGKTMRHHDDARNECFRVYENPKESYADHSLFLTSRKHYAPLFRLKSTDYRGWALGLKKAGYATNPRYPSMLIQKIERLKLYEFDTISSGEVYAVLLSRYPDLRRDNRFMAKQNNENFSSKAFFVPVGRKTVKISERFPVKTSYVFYLIKTHPNGRRYVILPENTGIAEVSRRFGIREKKLRRYNDLENSVLSKDRILFLEPKANKGNIATYTAKSGETMYDISQKFGIKLRKLYSKNRMPYGASLRIGQVVYLQDKKPRE
ncbi:MAG: LysM peptidoglycan-binding domain-containing protein [Bergeyella sp.]|nr:LysM peptidoglycan-binding domain-containing protein [Bergeyella sp.]